MKMFTCFCLFLAVFLFVFGQSAPARAEGFALYEYSARGIALGGAMMARKPDASAVAYNPALLTRLSGGRVMAGISTVTPSGKMNWSLQNGSKGSSSLKDKTWLVPHAYYTQQISDDWFFGIGELTRYGLGFSYPKEWPGNQNSYDVSLTSFSINPNIAWKATDSLSLAAGVEIIYGSLDMKKRTAINAVPVGQMDVSMKEVDGVGYGVNLAAHYQFNDEWAVGILYRSQATTTLKGDVKFSNAGLPDGTFQYLQGLGYTKGGTSTKVTLPDSVAGGVAWTPVPEFSLEAGAVWTRWSTFDKLDFDMPNGLSKVKNPKDWKNVWRFNAGAEWQALDWLALRAGYVYDQSPMTEKYADYLVPTDGRHIFSTGLGFKYEDWTIDVSYAYIHALGRKYNVDLGDKGTHVLDSKAVSSTTNIFSMSVGYEF